MTATTTPMAPDTTQEKLLQQQGYTHIAGIDEAGRGCWAGPVVAAAVVLAPQIIAAPAILAGVDDSKQLTALQREHCYAQIAASATSIGVGIVPAYVIDAFGIVPATRLAMTVAVLSLHCPVDALAIDALALPDIPLPQQVLIRGDAQCLSIAAASIVAKVTRDRLMRTADASYPAYGFAAHKGYGTPFHQRALASVGPCVLHRHTFRPVAAARGPGA